MMRVGDRRWWVLAALVVCVLTRGLDITIMNVALPTIATELSVGTDSLQWMINAYVLAFAGLMLPFGAIGDRYGRKRLLLIGLAATGVAALVAAWTEMPGVVIAARAVMGLGAAIIMPIALAVLAVLFSAEERGKAISFVVMGMGVGVPLGPIISGYLLDHFWWGSIFLVNVPVAAVGLVAIWALLDESKDPAPPRADFAGGVLSTVGLVIFVYGVIAAPDRGWGDGLVIATLAAAVVMLAAFVWWELRTTHPMIDLTLFRERPFLWGSVAAALASFALFGLLFVVPQYLQFVGGHDALGTGLRLVPMIGGLLVGAPLAEQIAQRSGYRLPISGGLLILGVGLAVGAATEASSGYPFAALWFAITGIGAGAALAPAMDAVLGVLPTERAGAGTAITMTMRQSGGALGVALLGSLLSQGYTDRVVVPPLPAQATDAARESVAGALAVAARLGDPALAASAKSAYVHGMTLVLVACAVLIVVGGGLVARFMPTRAVRRDADMATQSRAGATRW